MLPRVPSAALCASAALSVPRSPAIWTVLGLQVAEQWPGAWARYAVRRGLRDASGIVFPGQRLWLPLLERRVHRRRAL